MVKGGYLGGRREGEGRLEGKVGGDLVRYWRYSLRILEASLQMD